MRPRLVVTVALTCVIASAGLLAPGSVAPARADTPPGATTPARTRSRAAPREDRVAAARAQHGEAVRRAFDAAGAAWPPRGLFLRAFKAEGVVELWAAPRTGEPGRVHVRDFAVCRASGKLGPKRREGDAQVPEGFYRVDRFNRRSKFHLSLGIDYPNAVDRHRAGDAPPGGDIFIHGGCFTVGCLPLTDGPMSWLFVAALEARDAGHGDIPVHIFPCRMHEAACQARLAREGEGDPQLTAFWATLIEGYLPFEGSRVPPRVTARPDGTYAIAAGR